uniref:Protein kinase domain-containing protein n=1 Tax=Schizophyllum commune (strain H4-8 / FGSC 9210) TaxID=578458 RepID=D8PXE4_SCHCM
MPEVNAPFGSWTTDIELKSLEPGIMQALMLGVTRTVKSLKTDDGAYALKYWYDPVPQEDVLRQMQICIQAEDCAVPIVGRVFDDGAMVGYVMPLETPLDPASIATKDERLAIIHELCDLVERLHQKDIVHGDLKCQNLVRCANGFLRFIDFDCASRVGDGYVATQATAEFISQRRMLRHGFNPEPLTLAEDYHALALTIFELYTGQDNFYRFGPLSAEDYEEWSSVCCDAVVVGMPPDVSRIDDADIAQLIMSYFNRAPPRILTSSSTSCPIVVFLDNATHIPVSFAAICANAMGILFVLTYLSRLQRRKRAKGVLHVEVHTYDRICGNGG